MTIYNSVDNLDSGVYYKDKSIHHNSHQQNINKILSISILLLFQHHGQNKERLKKKKKDKRER